MAFWIAALAVALATAAWIARPLALARARARSRAAHDEQVFRAQLAELERDVERGLVGPDEARAARIEISRRLLAAAAEREATPDHAPAPRALSLALAAALAIGAPAGGVALYRVLGAPGLPDMPLSARDSGARPGQDAAETEIARHMGAPVPEAGEDFLKLLGELEARVAAEPDREGLWMLAQSYSRLERFGDAWRAYRRLIDLTGGDAPGAVFTAMGESMILAARGYISPEAEAALTEALRRDPENPVARYYMGAAFAQTGRPESAFETWAGLIADSPEGAPWLESTRAQVYELAAREGVEPPPLPSPRRATPEEEQAIMEDMVARLEARLVAEGGQAGDWLRLVKSHRALGDPAAAEDAAARARAALGADATQLAAFEQALAAPETADPAPGAGAHDVREMVARLDARLASQGGPAADWLKLISSYAALNDPDAARDALARARSALAAAPQELAALEGAIGEGPAAPAPALRNPTAEEMAAASEMSDADRQEMIRNMVSGLRERLFAEGGSPEEWVRLIRSLGVLGDVEGATEAWRAASEAHAADRSAVSFITEAAALAGVAIR